MIRKILILSFCILFLASANLIAQPTLTTANIDITPNSGSGSGGVFLIDDVITVTWDNSATGDNQPGVTAATVDFTNVGGGSSVGATETPPASGLWVANYTLAAGSIDAAGLTISVSATDGVGTSIPLADDETLSVDLEIPSLTVARIDIKTTGSGSGGTFIVTDNIEFEWDASADGNTDISSVTMDFSEFGGGSAIVATESAGKWTANYVLPAGSIDDVDLNVSVTATDDAGNETTLQDTDNLDVDNEPPTVTVGEISITTSGTGTAGTFIQGDLITVQWDNSAATGDGNADVSAVAVDFTEFGGPAATSATESSDIWTASFTVDTSPVIDGIGLNAFVTVTDDDGNIVITEDDSDIVVDNEAPTVSNGNFSITSPPSGLGSRYIIGDLVTVEWNNTGTGDNNPDITGVDVDFTEFGGPSSLAATESSGTWTASYTIVSGTIDGGNKNVFVTATDDAGYTDNTEGNDNEDVDNDPAGIITANTSLSANNDFINIEFDDNVSKSDGTSPVDGNDFDVFFLDNGGNATGATIVTATKWNGDALTGPATEIRLNFTLTNPPASGVESIEIKPKSNSVFDDRGNPSSTSETSGVEVLNDKLAPSGYTVAIDAGNDPNKINVTNETAFSFTFSDAEVGTTYDFSIDDASLSGPIVGSGTIAAADEQITGIDVSGLNDELLTLTVYLTDGNSNQGSDVTDDITKDTSPPVFTVGPTVTDVIDEVSFTLNFTADEDGTIYWTTVDNIPGGTGDGSAHVTITPLEVKNAVQGVNIGTPPYPAGQGGSFTFSGGVPVAEVVSQTLWSSYDLYFVAEGNTITGSGALQTSTTVEADAIETGLVTATNVTATNADGPYGIDDVITIQVTFSDPVTVGGSPRILLETGSTDRYATYNGTGSGTTTLQFDYTVVLNDVSSDLEYESSSTIELNGGTLTSTGTVSLDLPIIGGGNSLGDNKNIEIDGIPPVLTAIASPSTGFRKVGESITVTVTGDASGYSLVGTALVNTIDVGSFTPSGNDYIFTYNVLEGHDDQATNSLPISITLEDAVGNPTTVNTFTGGTPEVDANTPTATATLITPDGTTVIIGQDVNVTLTAGGAENDLLVGTVATINGVDVTGFFTNNTDGTYTYTYTLADLQSDWSSGSLAINLGLQDAAGNEVAVNTLPANTLAGDANRPDLTTVTIASNNVNPIYAKVGDIVTLSLTANETLNLGSINTAFTTNSVPVNNPDIAGGSFPNYTSQYTTSISDNDGGSGLVEFTINFQDVSGNAGTAVVTKTGGSDVLFDKTDPTLSSLLPANNKLSVPIDANLTISLDDLVSKTAVPGLEIRIFDNNGGSPVIFETFEVSSNPAITTSGNDITINPTVNFANGAEYYVEIDNGAILDKAGNPYAGFSGSGDWFFQTFASPTVTDIMETSGASSICVGSTITIEGQFFVGYTNNEGVTQVEFCYVNAPFTCFIANPGSISVISDTQLQVDVPTDMLQDVNVKLTKAEDVTPIGTNPLTDSGPSADQVTVGPSSALIELDGINTVCSEGVSSSSIKVTIVGGVGPYSIDYQINGGGTINFPNYTSADPIPVDPPNTGPNNYTLVAVTDFNGCTAPVLSGLAAITEFTKSDVTLNPIPPQCLVGFSTGDKIPLVGTFIGAVTGSSQTAMWSTSNGTGTFTDITDDLSGNHTAKYQVTAQDIALDELFIELTSTGSTLPCIEDSDVIAVTFTTSQAADMGPDFDICTGTGFIDIVGTIGGGATQGSFASDGNGTWSVSPNNIPVDGNNQVFITYTLGSQDLDGFQITLTPSGGTCGTPIDGILNVGVNSLPTPAIVAGDLDVCVNNTLITYEITDTPGSSYAWDITPPGNSTIVVGQGTSKIFVDWGSMDGGYDVEVIETNDQGCQSLPIVYNVTLNPLPLPVFVDPTARLISASSPNVSLVGGYQNDPLVPFDRQDPLTYTVDNGVFTGPGVIQDQGGNYLFDPDVAGINIHNIDFNYIDVNGCSDTVTEPFTVFEGSTDLAIAGTFETQFLAEEYCEDNGLVFLELSSLAIARIIPGWQFDTFTGPGITPTGGYTVTYDPQEAANLTGGGAVLIQYTQSFHYFFPPFFDFFVYEPLGSATTKVNLLPDLAHEPILPAYCNDQAPVDLERNPIANPEQTFSFTVIETNIGGVITSGDPNGLITGDPLTGYELNPANEVFAPDDFLPHVVTYEYYYENGIGCSNTELFQVTINQLPPAPTAPDVEACEGEEAGTLTVVDPVLNANIRWYDNALLTGIPFIGTIYSPEITQDVTLFYVTQEINGCESPATEVRVEIFPLPDVDMVGFNDPVLAEYCAGDAAFLLSLTPTSGGVFSGDTDGVVDNGDGTFSFDPLLAIGGTNNIQEPQDLTLIYATEITATGCVKEVIQNIKINPTNFVQILNLQDLQEFCVDAEELELTPNISTGSEGTGLFTGNGIISGNVFSATVAGVGTHPITYTFTNSNGCVDFETLDVIVNPLPLPSYDVGIVCAEQAAQFTSTTPGNIVEWQWIFNDANATSVDNESDLENPEHIFSVPGVYNVDLTVIDDKGCQATFTNAITVGEIPQTSFKFEAIAEQKESHFFNTTSALTNSVVAQVKWTFQESDGSLIDEVIITDPVEIAANDTVPYTFTTVGVKKVILEITTDRGCIAYDETDFFTVPFVNQSETVTYFEDFENADNGWVSWGLDNPNSEWVYGTSDGVFEDPGRGNYWYTEPNTDNEDVSVVYSPLFDLTGLVRPVLTLNTNTDTQNGALIQYSTDGRFGENAWKTLGQKESGIGWYNVEVDQDLQTIPGNLIGYGWQSEEDSDGGWLESIHSLTDITTGRDNVVFRIIFKGIQGLPATKGFAFDNIKISDRDRIVLLEHFENSSSTNASNLQEISDFATVDGVLNTSELVKLQYRTGFGGEDDVDYIRNRSDVNARALFYDINSANRAVMDGDNLETDEFSEWGSREFGTKSLTSPKLEFMSVDIEQRSTGELDFDIIVKANETIPNFVVQIAIVEKSSETNLEYVMRKMVPDASGAKVGSLNADEEFVLPTVTWKEPKLTGELAAIIFAQLQDPDDLRDPPYHSILQTMILDVAVDPDNILTGISELGEERKIILYPNPASQQVYVEFFSYEQKTVRVFDQFGRMVFDRDLDQGEKTLQIETAEFASGVYFLQIESVENELIREKFILSH